MNPPKAPTKHQLKSEATRTALLEAAALIFARDGYERAQIDEIAKMSGRTRGAVYAQYKTKEQLFFAVQEQRISDATRNAQAALSKLGGASQQKRLRVVRETFADLDESRAAFLEIELKLYAIRNPDASKAWHDQFIQIFEGEQFAKEFGLKREPGRSKIESRYLALSSLKSGLMLALYFLPERLAPKEVSQVLREVFDGLFPPSSFRESGEVKAGGKNRRSRTA
jgi:AcrR family transcriptional regulator